MILKFLLLNHQRHIGIFDPQRFFAADQFFVGQIEKESEIPKKQFLKFSLGQTGVFESKNSFFRKFSVFEAHFLKIQQNFSIFFLCFLNSTRSKTYKFTVFKLLNWFLQFLIFSEFLYFSRFSTCRVPRHMSCLSKEEDFEV